MIPKKQRNQGKKNDPQPGSKKRAKEITITEQKVYSKKKITQYNSKDEAIIETKEEVVRVVEVSWIKSLKETKEGREKLLI
jgi:hypothetical protein